MAHAPVCSIDLPNWMFAFRRLLTNDPSKIHMEIIHTKAFFTNPQNGGKGRSERKKSCRIIQ